MNKLSALSLATFCAGLLVIGSASTADAMHPLARGFGFGSALGGWYGGYADGLSLYRSGHIPVPPYFSLHPPVYYSAPVARSYGYSPFPYPGYMKTPCVEPVEPAPQTIQNPHVSPDQDAQRESAEPSDDTVAEVAPLIIHNPYVDMAPRSDEVHVARTQR